MNKLRKHSALIAIICFLIAIFVGLNIISDLAIKDARPFYGVVR